MRSSRWLLLAVLATLTLACSQPKSFIVLDLHSADTTEIHGVTMVVVKVTQPPSLNKRLTYPPKDGQPLVINQVNTNDLSIDFTGGRSGLVNLDVSVLDASGCTRGARDNVPVSISPGEIKFAAIYLVAETDCSTIDGGVDAQETDGEVFPGCDPVTPVCPMQTETCQVNCTISRGECTAGGTGGPGTPCATNKDCAPGSQCFDYSGTGCGVKVCLRFCNDDDHCGPRAVDAGAGDGGGSQAGASSSAGTRSVCQGVVPCGKVITGYHTCTFGCDPRQKAVASATTGCPTGLACLVIGGMDQVDCACAEATRKGTDGASCTGGVDCAPGYLCNDMASAKKCRAVCRCDADPATMTCKFPNECDGNKTCSALTNETTFGVCL